MPDKPVTVKPSVKSQDFRSLYANAVHFSLMPWELTLTFADVSREETDANIELRQEDLLAVRLSWNQAKITAILLAVNIALQEEKLGPVSIPPNIIAGWVDNADVHLPIMEMAKRIIKRFEDQQAAEKREGG